MKAPAPWFQVRFANPDREARCIEGETLFQCARRAGIRVVGACGGRGVCGTCMVQIVSGEVEFLRPEPGVSATPRISEWVRACQVRPLGDCTVEVSPRSLAPIVRAEVDGQGAVKVSPEPAARIHNVLIAPASLTGGGADADRVLDALRHSGAARFDLIALRKLSGLLRTSGWRLQATVRGDEVIDVGPAGRRSLGLAVDLGTTNVAGFIMDLETGTRLASLGIENPQASYGADLVSRVNYAILAPEGGAELRTAAVTAIAGLMRDLCDAVSVAPEEVVDIAICGNTAMHHLLLGLPVAQLGRAPFVPVMCEAIDVKARDLGLAAAAGAYAHLLPNVGGFVGGDHVAALLATENRRVHGTTIVMDIGTNTEISLIHAGSITTVSCPSGPALEGGHIGAGMRAAEGAIERVRIEDERIEVEVIGGVEPVGLCGSGVLDAVATMVQAGIIDRHGGIRAGHPAVREDGERLEVMLAHDVAFGQNDVRAVQLAKAAIRSGIDLLLREAGLEESALDQVVIAGAFGAYIGLESAVTIGLLPPLPLERFAQVGNAAGVGVRMTLASVALRERARRLAAQCRYIELGSLPGFQKTFLGRIGFE
ncbi:MAG: hypothetical protein A3H95_08750 [Acidobacteria bacterium RIFCSPLOWO2_02_FULL_64_15]|nr:MAG: hypothetical protein A3H95_08750 [Acidobacteria bacterium RIFCSPLOWO2_02_FULL_64_15]